MTEINYFMHDFRKWVKSIPDYEKILYLCRKWNY